MGNDEANPGPTDGPRRTDLSPTSALALAAGFGLLGGFADLACLIFMTVNYKDESYYLLSRHFPWMAPASSLAVLMVPGLLVAAVNRVGPRRVSLRTAAWLFATLGLWGPLLRFPLHAAASLLLAAGLGRWIGLGVARRGPSLGRIGRYGLAGMFALLGLIAAFTFGGPAWEKSRAPSRPAPPPGSRNVLLIVMDTVRAESLSLYGYARETTPNLARWAKRGIRFDRAISTAPWTFPSHSSLFTGQWPLHVNYYNKGQRRPTLDPARPTIAEHLSSRGYQTAGFSANTHYVSYETSMDRGFLHYEDYPFSPRFILSSGVPGRWIVNAILRLTDFPSLKWIRYQNRDAASINDSLLDWLSRPRGGRPFFAFVNYFDAHEPYLVPEGAGPRFGLRPESASDRELLLEWYYKDKRTVTDRELTLARDAYDDCIARLDGQVGALLDELDRRGELRNTEVIITSDHGEHLGEHNLFNHGWSLYMHELHVPLLVISPTVEPPGRAVAEPVSLRDLAATIADLAGQSSGSPFPGGSLADHWRTNPGSGRPATSPAFSEASIRLVLLPRDGQGPSQRGYSTSLVTEGMHYISDDRKKEELYALKGDPLERNNLKASPFGDPELARGFQRAILRLLADEQSRLGTGKGARK